MLEDSDFNSLEPSQRTNIWNTCVSLNCGLENKCLKNVPELTELDAVEGGIVERIESQCSREGEQLYVMEFIRNRRAQRLNFPDRSLLVDATFDDSRFREDLVFRQCQFEGSVSFQRIEATKVMFDKCAFHCQALFDRFKFGHHTSFVACHFREGASFSDAEFFEQADFFQSQFYIKRDQSYDLDAPCLVDFTRAKFKGLSCFDEAMFGAWDPRTDPSAFPKRSDNARYVDFSSATFDDAASFRGAAFVGHPPLFHNTTLHQGSSFFGVNWRQSEALHHPEGKGCFRHRIRFLEPGVPSTSPSTRPDVALQAWERLEEVIADLGSHAGRHAVFCSRSRTERPFLPNSARFLDALYDLFSGYGGKVPRAMFWWSFHWGVSAVVLAVSAIIAGHTDDIGSILISAVSVTFSNAHQFLFLTGEDGYLVEAKKFLAWATPSTIFRAVGAIEAVLGPVFLFLLLLTLRNQFRMR